MICILLPAMLAVSFGSTSIGQIIQNDESWVSAGYTATSTEVSFREYTDAEGDLVGMHVCFTDSLNGGWRIMFCFRNSILILEEGEERIESIYYSFSAQGACFSPNGRFVFLHSGEDYTGSDGLRIDTTTGEQLIYDPQPNGGWGMPWTYPHNDGSVVTRLGNSLYIFDEDLQCVLDYVDGHPHDEVCSDKGEIVLFADVWDIHAYDGSGDHLWTLEDDELGSVFAGAGLRSDITSDCRYAAIPLRNDILIVDVGTGQIIARILEGLTGLSAAFSPDDQMLVVVSTEPGGEKTIGVGSVTDFLDGTFQRVEYGRCSLTAKNITNEGISIISYNSFNRFIILDSELQPIWASGNLEPDLFPRIIGNTRFCAVDNSGHRFAFRNANGYLITGIGE